MSVRARPRRCLRDPIFGLSWENLGITPVELVEVSGERLSALIFLSDMVHSLNLRSV